MQSTKVMQLYETKPIVTNSTHRKNLLQFDLLMDYLRVIQNKCDKLELDKEVQELEALSEYIYKLNIVYNQNMEKQSEQNQETTALHYNFSDFPDIWLNLFKRELEWNVGKLNYSEQIRSVIFDRRVVSGIQNFLQAYEDNELSIEALNQKITLELDSFLSP